MAHQEGAYMTTPKEQAMKWIKNNVSFTNPNGEYDTEIKNDISKAIDIALEARDNEWLNALVKKGNECINNRLTIYFLLSVAEKMGFNIKKQFIEGKKQ